MKYIFFLLLLVGCNNSNLDKMVHEAENRGYHTVCSISNNINFCIITYSKIHPEYSFDFDNCVEETRMLVEKSRKKSRLEWCQCMAKMGPIEDRLYECGTGWFFKVYKVEENK